MVDYATALSIAKSRWNEIDYCAENENAFVFSKYGDRSIGGAEPVVVLKDTGECVGFTAYLCEGLVTPTIKEGRI